MVNLVSVGKRHYSFKKNGKSVRNWVYQARWRSPDGQDMTRSLRTKDKRRAIDLAREIEGLLGAGECPATARVLRFEGAWDQIHGLYRQVLAPQTLTNYFRAWEKFRAWMAPVDRVDQVTPVMVRRYRDWCLSPDGGGLSTRSTADHLVRNGSVYKKLQRNQLLPPQYSNPFAGVETPPSDTAPKTWLDPAQSRDLLAAAAALDRDAHIFVALGLFAGLRPKESVYLRWDWITWPTAGGTGWITVPVEDGDFKVKNKRSRNIPLAPELLARLAPFREAPRAFAIAPRRAPAVDPPACRDVALRWLPGPVLARLKVAVGLGDRPITPYTLRHTFASTALNAGVDHYTVMDWMGHRDVRTLQIYGHLAPDNPIIGRLYAPPTDELRRENLE